MNKCERYDSSLYNGGNTDDLYQLLNDGFFSDVPFGDNYVSTDGKLLFENLQKVYDMFGRRKYQTKYYLFHHNIVPTMGVPNAPKSPEAREAMYRDCLRRGITWEEYLGSSGDQEGRVY